MISPVPPDSPATVNSLKGRLIALNELSTSAYKIAAGLGAILTFWYLFTIEFFPSGLTPGEVVFFIFIAFAFGFFYIVFVLYSAVSSIWIAALLTAAFRLFTPSNSPARARSMVPKALRGGLLLTVSLLISLLFIVSALREDSIKLKEFLSVSYLVGLMVLIVASGGTMESRKAQAPIFGVMQH